MDAAGRPYLTDFGLAKDTRDTHLTPTAEVMGTLNYMSPEQVRALRRNVDHRTDVYSLGVVLYEMLTGAVPFEAETSKQLQDKILSKPPAPVRRLNDRVPRDLATIVHCAIEKDPGRRYASAEKFASDLGCFLSHRAISAFPPGLVLRLRDRVQQHRVAVVIIALIVIAAATGMVVEDLHNDAELRTEVRGNMERALELVDQDDAGDRIRGALQAAEAAERSSGLDEADRGLRDELARRFNARRSILDQEAMAAVLGAIIGKSRTTLDPQFGQTQPVRRAFDNVARAAGYAGRLSEDVGRELARLATVGIVLTIESDATAPIRVLVQSLDPVSGAVSPAHVVLRQHAAGTDAKFRLVPGYYRITVVQSGIGFSELVRSLKPNREDVSLVARIVPEAILTMRPIAAGRFPVTTRVNRGDTSGTIPMTVTVDLPAYYIDPRPVTNAEWEAFATATDARLPKHWPFLPKPADWGERPVTWIMFNEARAFAEYHGKRLPTRAEWEFAARGKDAWKFPWGDAADDRLDAFNLGRERYPAANMPKDQIRPRFDWYVNNVVAAGRTPPVSQGPNQLHDLVGNVLEWCDTPTWDRHGEVLLIDLESRFRMGLYCGSTKAHARENGLQWPSRAGVPYPQLTTGFRCARSEAPPPEGR
ncbi:MAG: hypothetical protein CMJ83_09190 [Planctomycetes bacterium]|nr:hypothetical protein [Planctomycetota bacterium]